MKGATVRLLLFVLLFPLLSQDNTFDFSAGLSMSRGNSNSTRFYGKGIVKFKRKDAGFIISTNYIYGRGEQKVDTNQGKLTFATEKPVIGRWKLISSASYFFDKMADIQGRVDFSFGLNYSMEEKSVKKISFSASYSEEYEAYFTRTSVKKTRRLSLQVNLNRRVNSGAKFSLAALYTPSLLNPEDFRFEGEASMKFLMKKPLWLNFSLSERYNNQPPSPTLKKNDIILITSLELTL